MFLIIHRLVMFVYLAFIYDKVSWFFPGTTYGDFLVVDYFTLILALFAGAWYGIWVGLAWFGAVYENNIHSGFIDNVVYRFWPGHNYNLRTKIDHVAKKMEADVWQLEDLAKTIPMAETSAAPKKRIVRRKKVE